MVQYAEEGFHSMHPEFIASELDDSLQRLGTSYLDCYLVHNCEHFLMANLDKNSSQRDRNRMQDQLKERLYYAFEQLEKEVANRRIMCYGMSSNAFALTANDPYYLMYRGFIDLAKRASKNVHGHDQHHFQVLQMPANVLEPEALTTVAPWAHQQGEEGIVFNNLIRYSSSIGRF